MGTVYGGIMKIPHSWNPVGGTEVYKSDRVDVHCKLELVITINNKCWKANWVTLIFVRYTVIKWLKKNIHCDKEK